MTSRISNKLPNVDIRAKSSLVFLGIFAQYGILFAIGILVARILGAEILGRYQLGISLTAVLSVFAQLGFNQGIIKFVPVYLKNGQFSEVNRIIRVSFLVSGTVASLIAILLVGFSDFFSDLLFHDQSMKGVIRYSGFYLIVYTLIQLLIAVFDSCQKQIIQTLISKFGISLVFLGILLYLICYRSPNSETLLFVRVVVEVIGVLCLFVIWKTQIFDKSNHPQNSNPQFRIGELISFSIPLFLVNAIQVVIMNIDILMIGWFMTANDVGVYTIYVMISRLGLLILTAVNSVIGPIISSHQSDANTVQQYKEILRGSTHLLVMVSANILLITVIFSDQFLGFFGNEFHQNEIVLWILTFGTFIHLASGPTGTFLVMSGNQKIELGNSVFLMLSNIVLNAILIPIYGIIGAAIATTASIALNKAGKTFQVYKLFRISPFDYFVFKKILVSTVLLSLFFFLRDWIAKSGSLYQWGVFLIIIVSLNIDIGRLYFSDREHRKACGD